MKPRTRLLAIDPGKVRLGLAISDSERRIASPLTTYTRRNPALDALFFKKIVADQDVAAIVIGLPIHEDGGEGEQAKLARVFGACSCTRRRGCRAFFTTSVSRRLRRSRALLGSGLDEEETEGAARSRGGADDLAGVPGCGLSGVAEDNPQTSEVKIANFRKLAILTSLV